MHLFTNMAVQISNQWEKTSPSSNFSHGMRALGPYHLGNLYALAFIAAPRYSALGLHCFHSFPAVGLHNHCTLSVLYLNLCCIEYLAFVVDFIFFIPSPQIPYLRPPRQEILPLESYNIFRQRIVRTGSLLHPGRSEDIKVDSNN